MHRLDELIAWYQSLRPDSVAEPGRFYAADARFRDPFTRRVRRRDRAHLPPHVRQVDEPRFVVTGRFSGEGGDDGRHAAGSSISTPAASARKRCASRAPATCA
jgi:hypothetical protein